MPVTLDEHEKYCYHEAGHIVVAEYFGISVKKVTFRGSKATTVLTDGYHQTAELFKSEPGKYQVEIERHIIYMCAGYSAEDRFCPIDYERSEEPNDYDGARWWCKLVCRDGETPGQCLDGLDEKSERIVEEKWLDIERMAKYLIREIPRTGGEIAL